MRIFAKLLISVLAAVLIIFTVIGYISYTQNTKILETEIEKRAITLLKTNTAELAERIETLQNLAVTIGVGYETFGPATEDDIKSLIRNALATVPYAYGSTIAFEPSIGPYEGKLFAPYYFRRGDDLKYLNLGTPEYNYPEKDWYKRSFMAGEALWSAPYIDVGGGETAMMTYSYPVRKNDVIKAIATVNVSLAELTKLVEKINVGSAGFALLIDKSGLILHGSQDTWKYGRNIFDIAKSRNAPEFKELGEKMAAGTTGFMPFDDHITGNQEWAVYGPVPKVDWSLAIMLSQSEVMGPIKDLHYDMILRIAVGVIALAVIIFLISRHMTKPIGDLANAAEQIAAGNFDTSLPQSSTHDEIGTLTRSFASMQTSLAQTIDNLRQEKELFGIAFSEMNDALIILDAEWNVLQFNHAAKKLLSLPTKVTFLNHISENFDSSVPMTEISQASHRSLSFRLVRQEDDVRNTLYIDATVTPIYDDNDNLKHYVVSAHDVTDIEASERSKRTFLALISHKLFTPITPLQGNIAMFKDGLVGELSDKQKKLIDKMSHQTGKLRGVIEKLVNFVTMEEDKLDKAREKIDLESFLKDLVEESHDWFPDTPTDIDINVEPAGATMSFNGKYLHLIVGQLIENGIKFNLNEPAHINVTCKQDEHDTTFVITDNGVGIPSEYIDKIFDKFFQVEKYFTGNVEGVGLGLTYVKTLVSHFGGTINVTSESGKGSTFTVTLHTK